MAALPWRVVTEASEAYRASRRSVARAARLPGIGLGLKRRLIHVLKLGDRVAVLRIAHAAGETLVSLQPTKAYLKKVAAAGAVQNDRIPVGVAFSHGWPILSSCDPVTTMAEGGGESISAPGGSCDKLRTGGGRA